MSATPMVPSLRRFFLLAGCFLLGTEPAIADLLFLSSQQTDEVHRYSATSTTNAVLDATFSANIDTPAQLGFNPAGELFVVNTTGTGSGSVARFVNATTTATANGTIADNNLDPGFDFGHPHGLAFRGDELFVVNSLHDNILRFNFDSNGVASSNGIISSGLAQGAHRGRFAAVSPWGELFVSECCEFDRINRYRFDTNGVAIFNGTITGLDNPHGMAFSITGELFVANAGHFPTASVGSVARYTFDTLDENGSATSNGFITGNGVVLPLDLAFSSEGELFVANGLSGLSNGGVSRFTFDNTGLAQSNGSFGAGIAYSGIAFAAAGVPEPSSLSLLGIGCIGLMRRRRQRGCGAEAYAKTE